MSNTFTNSTTYNEHGLWITMIIFRDYHNLAIFYRSDRLGYKSHAFVMSNRVCVLRMHVYQRILFLLFRAASSGAIFTYFFQHYSDIFFFWYTLTKCDWINTDTFYLSGRISGSLVSSNDRPYRILKLKLTQL